MTITKIEPNLINASADFTFNNVTATGNLSSLNANLGNLVTANYFSGNGSLLTGIVVSAGNAIVNGNSNVTVSANGNVTTSVAGNANILIITGTGANITGTLNATGNANVGNIGATGVIATTLGGSLTTTAQPNITSVGSLTGLTVSNATGIVNFITTANVALGAVANVHITGGSSGQYLQTDGSGGLSWSTVATGSSSNISNGNSNVNIPSANGNVNISAVGNANIVVVTGTGVNIAGTLNATGDLTASNASLGNAVTANYFTGNFYGTANLATYATTANAVAGANVSGQVGNALVAGTVYTAAQPNITSVGTLTSLSVTGNANTGNLGTTNLIATGTGSFGANVNMNNYWINNVGYPSATTDVATKAYVDTMVSSGIAYHQPVIVATTTTLATATSGTVSYNNGTAGVGANLTTTGTFLLIDGANVQTVGTRILVKNEANAAWNGVYEYTSTTVITRTSDADEYGPDSTEQLSINDYFFVQSGTVNQGTAYIVSAPAGTITFGVSNITFAEFSSSQVYSAGTGLTLTGTTFSVNASQTQITSVGTLTGLNVNGNITAANITANTGVFTGNGSGLSSIAGANVTGEVSYAATANSVAGSNVSGQVGNALVSGTVYTAAQPNITSVGTLSNLTSNGTVNFTNASNVALGPVGNVHITGGSSGQYLQTDGSGALSWATVSTGSASISNGNSNVNIPSANGNVNISAVGNANVLVVTGTGVNVAGTLNVTGNATLGNIITSGSGGNISNVNVISANTFIASSNANFANASNVALGPVANVHITGGSNGQYLQTDGSGTLTWSTVTSGSTSNISNGNSNVNIPSANGNINFTAVGNTVMVITGTGINVAGTLNATGNITGGNASLGNAVTANYFTGNFYGTANLATYATTANSVAGANVSGQVGNALISGTVYTNAQPNITSIGTLSNLTSNGTVNFTNASNVALGPVANVHITGGSNGQYLQTDGSGTLTWATVSSGSASNISNGNSNVNIPSANGNVNISAVGNANVLVITGTGANITGTLNVTGNATLGNLITSGSGGNISNVNVISANTFIASGNISAGNANLGNAVVANFFVGNGSQLTGITVSAGNTIVNGNSNVSIATANGNINLTAVGNTTMTVTGTGANITGTANITGNLTAGNANLGNAVTANYFTGNFYGTANLATYATTANAVAGANVSGQVGNALVADTVTTNAQPNITSVGTLTSLSVSGNITGGNLVTTGIGNISGLFVGLADKSANLNVFSANLTRSIGYRSAPANYTDTAGAVAVVNQAAVHTFMSANVTSLLGIEYSNLSTVYIQGAPANISPLFAPNRFALCVASGNSYFGGNIITTGITTGANTTAGSITGNWTLTAGSQLQATYADLSEYYEADQLYEPATVLEFGGEKEVTLAQDGTTRVAGVVSTDPAYVMNAACPGHAVPIALQGRVPVKVRGHIKKGDLMVSGGNGYARPWNNATPGMVIGKAIQNFEGVEGIIEIAVGRL